MRLAIFDNLPEGGAKRVAFEHVRGLSSKHDVYYFTNGATSHFPFESFAKKVFRYDLEYADHHGIFRPLKEMSIITQLFPEVTKLNRQLIELEIDCLIAHPSKISQAPILLSKTSVPSIYMCQEWYREMYEPDNFPTPPGGIAGWYESSRKFLLKELDWIAARSARKIVTSSGYNQNNIKKAYKRKAEVIPLGVDTKLFRPSSQKQRKHFLFVGERDAINGYDLLQSALNQVDWPIKVEYIEFNNGKFQLTDSQIVQKYQQAVATLCLAKNEPFGLSSIESQACATPVIAVKEGGYLETVVHEKTGLCIQRDPSSLIEAIKKLATRNEYREQLGNNARQEMLKNFTWKKHLSALEETIESIAA